MAFFFLLLVFLVFIALIVLFVVPPQLLGNFFSKVKEKCLVRKIRLERRNSWEPMRFHAAAAVLRRGPTARIAVLRPHLC